jgi:hypothetical protein
VGEVTAAATFYMAEVYSNFGRTLLESERPSSLNGAALQKYEDQLEEEAFPFEEKAIKVHEKNLELMSGGKLYNAWIEKSLGRLAQLMPGRYAKAEISSGYLASIDRYAYRSPSWREPTPAVADGTVSGASAQQVLPTALKPVAEKTMSAGGSNATTY